MGISVLILTYNEGVNLPACLESAAWSNDVVVLDSHSTDNTEGIVRTFGARLFRRKFDDFASQRNYAIDNLALQNSWVFHLDADERFTPELVEECRQVTAMDQHSGFLVPSKMVFWGRWLKHAATYPVYQMRLMKLGEVRFSQYGHGQREYCASRGVGKLCSPYLHYSFSKGLAEWVDRHNRYSTLEAEEMIREVAAGKPDWAGVLSSDPVRKRRALKQISFYLPGRPLLKAMYMYLLRGGILDGMPGLAYCILHVFYEYLISLKFEELQKRP
jgi:glycosyltransferase involved in cell wall biosynthesis